MDRDSDIIRAVSMTTIDCSKMTICPHSLLSTELLGRRYRYGKDGHGDPKPSLGFIVGENQLVEARDRFQLNRGKTFQ